MLQQLLPLIPREPGSLTLVLASIATLFGAGMWLAGAKFSRPVLTLAAVALGTIIGKNLPAWCGWSIDGMGPAVGGATIAGVSAFVWHRAWVGFWLGAVLAGWTALAVWLVVNPDPGWMWPPANSFMTLPQYLTSIWATLPIEVTKCVPFFCGMAFLSGAVAGILLPRIGLVLMWSAAGVSMLIGAIAMAIQGAGGAAIAKLPRQNWIQLSIIAAFVAAGALIQWRMTRTDLPEPAAEGSDPSR